MTRIGSLCSGYGGLDLAAESVLDAKTAWVCEYDAAPASILAARFPGVPNHGDVWDTDWSAVEPIDVLTAGYPCQPFSQAGNRKGTDDPRHLWPGVARAVGSLRPRIVLLENVRGHLSLGFDAVLSDLARMGYDARWGVVRASDAGAPHARARLFILARDASHNIGARPGVDTGSARRDAEQPSGTSGHAPDPYGDGLKGQPGASGRRHSVLEHVGADPDGCGASDRWGVYGPAITRWGRIMGRPAPDPVVTGEGGRPTLSPVFAEWLMGLPQGWVTGADVGLTRTAQLKALGNGVVPQQAALALRMLGAAA